MTDIDTETVLAAVQANIDATIGNPVFIELREDYLSLMRQYVPDFTGGPHEQIIAGLVEMGWRKTG